MKKLKYTIVGFVAGVLAATALTAGASTLYEKYTATARPDYKLVVDGKEVTLNNPAKIIEGSTHLPLKEIASIIGKDASFKDGTIELKNKEGDTVTEEVTTGWIPLSELEKTHGLISGVRLPQGADSSSKVREYTITIEKLVLVFEIPYVIVGDLSVFNSDGVELKYINAIPHLHESIIPSTTTLNK